MKKHGQGRGINKLCQSTKANKQKTHNTVLGAVQHSLIIVSEKPNGISWNDYTLI